jgi:hypothetical protein
MDSKTAPNKRFLLVCALHLGILFHLIIVQPLLQKLAENPEFLVAHAATPGDIFALIATLCLILPALLVLIEMIASVFGNTVLEVVHDSLIFSLFTILALLLIRNFHFFEGAPAIAIALLFGSGLIFIYRIPNARSSLTYLAPIMIVVPVLFLFNGSIQKLLSMDHVAAQSASKNATAPVVMIVFDELPITSLMNKDRLLDRTFYPNFAGLLEDFTWYRNTTTVSAWTETAVPALLTGKYPRRGLLPTLSDHPENVFTLLSGSHELKVSESVTSLCPSQLNVLSRETSPTRMARIRILVLDLAAIYLQMIVPLPYAAQLPDVTTTWGDFWGSKQENETKSDRSAYSETFIESTTSSEKPFFSFLHILLPHRPWRYLPEGIEYNDFREGRPNDKFWERDEWAARVAVQRHLLQLAYTDRLLGELLRHLKQTGLYNSCLIVIVADHGISMWPGEEIRKARETTYQDVLFVPFFLKAPFQKKGAIIDRKLETVDVLPTIIKILGIKTSWKFDGSSATDTHLPERRTRTVFISNRLVTGLAHDIRDQNRTLNRKLSLFGNATSISALYDIGPFPELVNRETSELSLSQSDLIVKLRGKAKFDNIKISSQTIPAYIAGEIKNSEDVVNELAIAIAINGKIRVVTKAFHSAEKLRFSAIVPPSAFSNGKNTVQVIVIPDPTGQRFLLAALE